FLLARALSATMARERQPKKHHRPFHIVIDEAKNFGPRVIADLLTDARKFFVSVTVSTQYLSNLDPEAQQAILGSPGTLISSRLAPDDARHLAPLFDREHQHFNPHVLYNLELGEAWYRGSSLYPDFHPQTFPNPEKARQQSRRHYTEPRRIIE